MSYEALPSDSGYLIGAELSFWGLAPIDSGYKRHLNLFIKYSKGLAAFDPLTTPTSFDIDLRTTNANQFLVGASGNWDFKYGNALIGALSRRFIDADDDGSSPDGNFDDGWEYCAVDPRARSVRAYPDVYVWRRHLVSSSASRARSTRTPSAPKTPRSSRSLR